MNVPEIVNLNDDFSGGQNGDTEVLGSESCNSCHRCFL